MATSSFTKTIVVETDKAAEALIQAMESRLGAPSVAASTFSYKVASKETLVKKNGSR